MRKKIAMFIAAAAGIIILTIAAVLLISKPGETPRTEVPEFILPENSAQESAETESSAEYPQSSENTSQAASVTPAVTSSAPAFSEAASEAQPDVTQPAETKPAETKPASSEAPAESAANSSAAATSAEEIPTEAVTTQTTSPEAEKPVEIIPDNVLVTSGDPLHYIRFEFQPDKIMFSGVYSGDEVYDVYVMKSTAQCKDLTRSGSSFSGSIDVSSLTTGYYIIQVKLSSMSVMNFVFEMTVEGARNIPEDELPAANNLRCTENPLELPAEGVMQYITVSGDKEKAAEILRQIQQLSDEICAGITDDYDKARTLAEWVSRNMYYDKDAAANGVTEEEITLEFVLEYHRSVCFGWSNLYSALCQAQGIRCFNASGSVVTGSRCFLQTQTSDERSHSWNMVIINGEKIWVDTVWNSDNAYLNGSYNQGSVNFKFFGISNGLLAHDHRVTRFEYRDYSAFAE